MVDCKVKSVLGLSQGIIECLVNQKTLGNVFKICQNLIEMITLAGDC